MHEVGNSTLRRRAHRAREVRAEPHAHMLLATARDTWQRTRGRLVRSRRQKTASDLFRNVHECARNVHDVHVDFDSYSGYSLHQAECAT